MAKKKENEAPAEAAPEMVTVTALCNLYECDSHRKKGEVFEMPAARAAVLPELVSIVDAAAE
jgi:hypothetical protein